MSNLSVKVTADVTELTTKFAIARAETSALTAEFNKLARATAAGTIDTGGSARMQQLAGDMLAAKTQANALGTALGQASGGILGISQSLEHSHGSISTATREFRALFDELSSGRTRQTPGTLAIIAQRVLGLGPAALGAVAGVVALVGGLGYLAYRAIEAKNALDQIQLGAQFAGNMDVSREALEQFSNELAKSSRISQSGAREIVGAFASMHDLSETQIHALVAVVDDFAQVTGQKATEAKAALEKGFSNTESAVAFAKTIGGVTQAQLNSAEQADRAGNAQQIFAEKFDILNSALDRSRAGIDKHNSSLTSSILTFLKYYGVVQGANGLEQGQTKLIEDQNAARAEQVKLLDQLRTEMAATPAQPDQTLKVGVQAAEKENPIAMQAEEAKAKIAEMNAALSIAIEKGDDVSVDKLSAGLAKAKEELGALNFGPVLERMRTQMEQVAATWDGTQSGMLAKQLQIAQATIAQTQAGSKERLEVVQEEARLEVQIRKTAGDEAIANARAQIAATTGSAGTTEKLEAERDVWGELLAGDKLNAQQRTEVQRSFNADVAGIERERVSEAAAIARSDASTDIAISRLRLEAEKSSLDAGVTATQGAVREKFDALKTLADEEFALDLQVLNNELAMLPQGTAAYEQAYNQIRELKARLVTELAALDRQEAEDAKKVAKEQASDWKGVVGEIENSESGLVSDLITKRKTLAQSLAQIGADLVTREIADDVKAVTTRILLQETAANSQKAMEQGGILYHLFAQTQQTATTVQQQAAQTGAVAAGNSVRLSQEAAAAAAGKSIQASTGGAQVMADAAKAAAGAYSAVAGIPIIGPVLAPIAAGVAYGAVAAYEGLASLDTGTNFVPADQLAFIHQGEAVVPKEYNPAAGGEMPGGSEGGGNFHLHLNLSAFDASGMERLVHSSAFQSHIASSMSKYVNRGGRGAR